jgi:hypothetical protein
LECVGPSGSPSCEEAWDIFEKDPSGSGLSDDAGNVGPEVPGVIDAALLAGDGEGLTGEAAVHEVHHAAPGQPVEGGEVRPDRGTIQPPVVLTPKEYFLAERVEFDVGNRLVAVDGLREATIKTAYSAA